MTDFNRCISALTKAAGRELTAEELAAVFSRIQRTARDLKAGRIEPLPGPHNLASEEGLIMHAAEIEAQAMVQEAERKARNAVAQATVIAARQAEVGAMRTGGISGVDAVRRLLVNLPDGRADQFSLEARVKGISQLLKSRMVDTWLAMDRRFVEYLQGEDRMKLLLQEIRGRDTGDAVAKKGAQAWRDLTEDARRWFNERGGDVGHLEDWGMPQHHSQEAVARVGREAWASFVFDRLDRSRYTDLAGNLMDDAEVRAILDAAWDSIATNGANKIEPGKHRGTAARSNQHREERHIHFKDADAVIDYWKRFGERTMPEIMMGHLETMARDIAFLEHLGPNPDATFAMLRDSAERADKLASPAKLDRVDKELARLERTYDYASGKVKPVANQGVAAFFNIAHNLNVAGKLGSAVWSSLIGDKVMFEAIGRVNNLPAFQRWHNELRLLNPANVDERRQLRRHGLMLDYMTQAMYRFGDELGKSSLTGKLANGVMKVTGMAAVNEWRRGAWALTAMDTLGHLVGTKRWAEVGADDMRLLGSYGITEHDWRVWQLARLDDLGHGNDTALTPESIARITEGRLRAAGVLGAADGPRAAAAVRRDAMVKLMGALTSESHMAVIEPGWRQRTMMYGGLQRGNARDELVRSFWQFKSFPIAQFEQMMQVGLSRPTAGGKVGFLTAVPVMLTIAGAMQIQLQEILAGKDPRPMADWRFWLAAFLKGGSLGLYGDFLFSQSGETRYGTGPLEALAGPTIGPVADLAVTAARAPGKIAQGKDAQVAARVIQIGKGFIPGQNMWMTKAATDHLIFQNAQEMLNPGYLNGMRSRARRELGNDWWWEPGEALPSRAPDLGNAFKDH
jgi:hypothetical protein